MQFLLYGANGYTGELIARFAKEQGLNLLLAGRNQAAVQEVAQKYGFEYIAFSLDDTTQLEAVLSKVPVVIHAAGPFAITAKPMIEACLKTNTHYLDITGEIEVFELCATYDAQAKAKNIMIMPGVGFDVVPSDSLAAFLKQQLPDATHLRLAFAGVGAMLSHGTAITMTRNIEKGGAIRKDGKITPVPAAYQSETIAFSQQKLLCMTIPWGDVSTAYYTTGIPNIMVYMGVTPGMLKNAKRLKYIGWFLGLSFVKNFMIKKIKQKPAGPSDERRKKAKSLLWGEVKNAQGQTVVATLDCLEGYTLTALSSLLIAQKVIAGNWQAGHKTPAGMYGPDLIMELPDSQRNIVSK